MEPLTMILTALSAGAIAALQETAAAGVKDAYQGLKSLIEKKFSSQPKGNEHLNEYVNDPETWEKPFSKDLRHAAADQDEQILQAAKALLELLNAQPEGNKYNFNITNSQGVVVGDNANVQMSFGDKPTGKS